MTIVSNVVDKSTGKSVNVRPAWDGSGGRSWGDNERVSKVSLEGMLHIQRVISQLN